VILRNDHSGQLPDVQPGNFVTVTYETPDNKLTALQIAQTSAKFSGTLTAIDLQDKTLKAKSTFGTRRSRWVTTAKLSSRKPWADN